MSTFDVTRVRRPTPASAPIRPVAPMPPLVTSVLATSGEPLATSVRSQMEGRLGHDLSRVRVHADNLAARSATAISAQAYTFGQHVVMGQGRYRPHTEAGQRLLAHELTHVVQQGGRSGEVARPASISSPEDASEREADAVAAGVTSRVVRTAESRVARQQAGDRAGATTSTPAGDPGPAPPPPSTRRTTRVTRQPVPPDAGRALDAAARTVGTGAARGVGTGQGGSAVPGTATAQRPDLPDTDPVRQGQVMAQWAAPLTPADASFVPFVLSASLVFPSKWAIADWRYHANRSGPVAWWEHLDVLGAPALQLGAGVGLDSVIHLQPGVALNLLQYHMTEGSGAGQVDNDLALAAQAGADVTFAHGVHGGAPINAQVSWTHTTGGTNVFQIVLQGGYDPVARQWSGVLGIGWGLAVPLGENAPLRR